MIVEALPYHTSTISENRFRLNLQTACNSADSTTAVVRDSMNSKRRRSEQCTTTLEFEQPTHGKWSVCTYKLQVPIDSNGRTVLELSLFVRGVRLTTGGHAVSCSHRPTMTRCKNRTSQREARFLCKNRKIVACSPMIHRTISLHGVTTGG